MDERRSGKVNIPLCLAAVLLCLVLFTTHMTSGLYARYTSTASGSDGARVAKFEITDDLSSFTTALSFETSPSEDKEKPCQKVSIEVSNGSEVAVAYTVTIANTTQNVPYKFAINGAAPPTLHSATGTAVLAPEANTTVTIDIYWDDTAGTAVTCMGMVDKITIDVEAAQID